MRAADVLAIGPGLGTGDWAQRLWAAALAAGVPDGGRCRRAESAGAESRSSCPPDWIITPHPGEAARLLGIDDRRGAGRPPRRRARAARALRRGGRAQGRGHAGGLRARRTRRSSRSANAAIPAWPPPAWATCSPASSPGCARKCGDSAQAARIGVLVHALAGDSAAQGGQRGLVASDVIARVARLGESVTHAEPRDVAHPKRRGDRGARRALAGHAAGARRSVPGRVAVAASSGRASRRSRAACCARSACAGAIKSPSYTLLETYELPAVHAVHLDLYRLIDPAELEHLGLADYHRPGFLWLIEWPERGAGRLPAPDLQFEFSIDGRRSSNRED